MPTPVPFPLINGNRYSRSSTNLVWAGVQLFGWKAFDFSNEKTRPMTYGGGSKPSGRTRGKLKSVASVTLYKHDLETYVKPALVALGAPLGLGYMDVGASISAQFWEQALGTSRILMVGASIEKEEETVGDGDDELEVKLTLSLMDLIINGQPSVIDPFGPGSAPIGI